MYDFSREKVHKIVRRPETGVELYRMIVTASVPGTREFKWHAKPGMPPCQDMTPDATLAR